MTIISNKIKAITQLTEDIGKVSGEIKPQQEQEKSQEGETEQKETARKQSA